MSISLLQRLCEVPFAVVDVETTGAGTQYGDRVIEVGIVRVEGGRIVRQYQQFIDPRRRISPGVVALTGITPEMVAGQPAFPQQAPAMLEMLRGAVILGHNIPFDLSFLRHEMRLCGRDLAADLEQPHVMDTVRIARRRFGRGGNGLQTLCRRLGYAPEVAHRALADVITTYEVFDRLLQPVGGWDLSLCDALMQQGGPMKIAADESEGPAFPLELTEALEMRVPVMMEYLDASQRRTKRVIQPIEVRSFKGELTLIAHCQLRNDRRTFKLDRVVSMTRLSDCNHPA